MSKNVLSKIWRNWNTDRIVGLSAMFISLLTLITFVYQTNLMKQQAALSVLPYLSVTTSYSSDSFRLSLINEGVGPAIIESKKIFFNGAEYEEEFNEFLKRHIPMLDTLPGISFGSIDYGTVLPSGEEIYLIAAFDNFETINLLAGTIQALGAADLDFEIVYRSIYEERWKITDSDQLPLKLPKNPKRL